MSLIETLTTARSVSVPLCAVETPDQPASVDDITRAFGADSPVVRWDLVRGLVGMNTLGKQACVQAKIEAAETTAPTEALEAAARLPDDSVVLMLNMQNYLDQGVQGFAGVVQAVCNLRDDFARKGNMLVMMGVGLRLPVELAGDTLSIDEPLPDAQKAGENIQATYKAIATQYPDVFTSSELEPEGLAKAVDATIGLPAFGIQQAVAMSLSDKGLDYGELWERKRKVIDSVRGLSVYRGSETFKDVQGCANVLGFLRDFMQGEIPVRGVAILDEVEKMIGTGYDTSGVSQSLLGTFLTRLQTFLDRGSAGMIAIGPPGAGKSVVAKACGGEFGVPSLMFDLTGMKSSLVGESEGYLRAGLNALEAMSEGRVLFFATCNSISVLPVELRRRFTLGTFFFDYPDQTERAALWTYYGAKYGLPEQERPKDENWTGAEIKQCSELAWRLRTNLLRAASYIVPVSVAAADQLERLRDEAHGKYISASREGLYEKPNGVTKDDGAVRKFRLPPPAVEGTGISPN